MSEDEYLICDVKRYNPEGELIEVISGEELSKREKFKEDLEWKKRRLEAIKSRCSMNNIPFDLTVDDLTMPVECPVLGIPLDYDRKVGHKGPKENTPTVDRIVPEKGYVKGNILMVSMKANRLKNNASIEELEKIWNFYKFYRNP